MGDIGCPLTREQKDLLKHLDAILIPVGGYYTIDAVQAKAVVDDLAPRAVIPMHYRSDHFGYPVIGRLEEFTGLCRNVVEYDSNTLVLTIFAAVFRDDPTGGVKIQLSCPLKYRV